MGEILGRVMTVAGSQITVNPEAEIGRAPDPANRPRSDQTTHREGRPQSRRPNPEPATSCYYWSWRGLHRRATPGSFGFQHPETTPPSIPTTLRTAPLAIQPRALFGRPLVRAPTRLAAGRKWLCLAKKPFRLKQHSERWATLSVFGLRSLV